MILDSHSLGLSRCFLDLENFKPRKYIMNSWRILLGLLCTLGMKLLHPMKILLISCLVMGLSLRNSSHWGYILLEAYSFWCGFYCACPPLAFQIIMSKFCWFCWKVSPSSAIQDTLGGEIFERLIHIVNTVVQQGNVGICLVFIFFLPFLFINTSIEIMIIKYIFWNLHLTFTIFVSEK